MCNELNVTEMKGAFKYLGMPLGVRRKKKDAFSFIQDKLWSRLNAWKQRKLSKADKEIIIKTIAQALPTYIMSLYKLLDTFYDDLQKLMNGYWWGGSGNSGAYDG